MLYLPNAGRFSGIVNSLGAGINQCQLFNPAASGTRVYVVGLSVSMQNSGLRLARGSVALTTVVTDRADRQGSAVPVAELRGQTGTTPGVWFAEYVTAGGFDPTFRFDWADNPFVLSEGEGLNGWGTTNGANVYFTFDWLEVPV